MARQLTSSEHLQLNHLRHLINELESGMAQEHTAYAIACCECIKSCADVIKVCYVIPLRIEGDHHE